METPVSLPNKEFLSSSAVLLGKCLGEVAPEIRPAALEQQVLGNIGGVKVRGYIDIVDCCLLAEHAAGIRRAGARRKLRVKWCRSQKPISAVGR